MPTAVKIPPPSLRFLRRLGTTRGPGLRTAPRLPRGWPGCSLTGTAPRPPRDPPRRELGAAICFSFWRASHPFSRNEGRGRKIGQVFGGPQTMLTHVSWARSKIRADLGHPLVKQAATQCIPSISRWKQREVLALTLRAWLQQRPVATSAQCPVECQRPNKEFRGATQLAPATGALNKTTQLLRYAWATRSIWKFIKP